jgi:RNA polymerase sigma-70 factor (ECF subfamily)
VRRKGATPAQLEALYLERFGHFARVAAAICRDRDRGRDAVQEAFTTAVRERRSFRATGSLEAWVWRIVVNEAHRIAREPSTEPLLAVHVGAANGRPTDRAGLRERIAALPERQRETLFLRYYADLDYRTIAQVLGVEVGTVSAALSAAHRNLRRNIQEAPT